MRTFIIIVFLSICQQAFCTSTKCELSLVSLDLETGNQAEQEQIQRSELQNKAVELFYTVDSLILDDHIVAALWREQSYYISDLVQYTKSQLLKLPGISKRDVIKIRKKLLAKGLHLGIHIPYQIIQETAQKIFREKTSLYMKFIENVHSIPENILRNEFINKIIIEIDKLSDSKLYFPIKIHGDYNVRGAFKHVAFYLQHPKKPLHTNSDIRQQALNHIGFIMQRQNINTSYEN